MTPDPILVGSFAPVYFPASLPGTVPYNERYNKLWRAPSRNSSRRAEWNDTCHRFYPKGVKCLLWRNVTCTAVKDL